MKLFLSRMFWWALAGALLAVLGAAGWYTYVIVDAGESIKDLSIITVAIDFMRLHVWAAWGAGAGVARAVALGRSALRGRGGTALKACAEGGATVRVLRGSWGGGNSRAPP